MKNFIKRDTVIVIKSTLLTLLLVTFITHAWTGPQPSGTIPPANNTDAPINVGSLLQ